jgi:hypothetical protein
MRMGPLHALDEVFRPATIAHDKHQNVFPSRVLLYCEGQKDPAKSPYVHTFYTYGAGYLRNHRLARYLNAALHTALARICESVPHLF